jgi:hypothetical protein
VLRIEKNLAAEQHTRRRRRRFVVQGRFGASIERLSFTLWIYEEKKQSKVPYRNQIASNPRLGNALESWCTTVQHHAVESGHHRRRLFERNPLSGWQKPFRKSRKLSGTGRIIAEELGSAMRRSVLHSWAKKNLLIASNPRNKNFKCCRNCVCRWLRC